MFLRLHTHSFYFPRRCFCFRLSIIRKVKQGLEGFSWEWIGLPNDIRATQLSYRIWSGYLLCSLLHKPNYFVSKVGTGDFCVLPSNQLAKEVLICRTGIRTSLAVVVCRIGDRLGGLKLTFFQAYFDAIVIIPFFQGDSSKYFLDHLERVGRPVSCFGILLTCTLHFRTFNRRKVLTEDVNIPTNLWSFRENLSLSYSFSSYYSQQ